MSNLSVRRVITAPIDVYMIDLWTKNAEVLNPRPAEITGVAALQGPFSYLALHAFCCPIQNICRNPAGKACPQKPPSRSSGRHQIIPAITVHILRFSLARSPLLSPLIVFHFQVSTRNFRRLHKSAAYSAIPPIVSHRI